MGFTLIELLVVVAIMSIIGLFAVSSTLRLLSKQKRPLAAQAQKAVEQQAPQVVEFVRSGGEIRQRSLQAVIGTKIRVNLEVDYLLDEGKVTPTYQAAFQGRYRLQNPLMKAARVRLFFPFPVGAGTFSEMAFLVSKPKTDPSFFSEVPGFDPSALSPPDAPSVPRPPLPSEPFSPVSPEAAPSLAPPTSQPIGPPSSQAASKKRQTDPPRVPQPRRKPSSPQEMSLTDLRGFYSPRKGVAITDRGVYWDTIWQAGAQQEAYIRYRVQGRDKYQYQIAAGKKEFFDVSIVIQGAFPEIPAKALQTTQMERSIRPETTTLTWKFRDFLTVQNIEVRFPTHFAKFHRFGLLGRMAWIAVLLFTFFFWYFAERTHAAKIVSSGSTTVNFGLLIFGFLSFFPLFLYLGEHLAFFGAFTVALSVAVVLTTIHVSLFMDLRWALSRSLPLQVFFTVGFAFAILSPTYRPLTITFGGIFLIGVFVVMHARYQREARQKEALAQKARLEEAAIQNRRLEEEKKNAVVPTFTPLSSMSFDGPPSEAFKSHAPSSSSGVHAPFAEGKGKGKAGPGHAKSGASHDRLEERFCLFCGVSVALHFKHCPDCGKFLKRTFSCVKCKSVYWYPSVERFCFCQECGTPLIADASPLPLGEFEEGKGKGSA